MRAERNIMSQILTDTWDSFSHSQFTQEYILNPVVWGFYGIIILVYIVCMFIIGRLTKNVSPEGVIRSAKISLFLGIEAIHIPVYIIGLNSPKMTHTVFNYVIYFIGEWILIALPFLIIMLILRLPLINKLTPHLMMFAFTPYTLAMKGRCSSKEEDSVQYLNEDD